MFQYRLKTLLIVVTLFALLICVPLAYWAIERQRQIDMWGPNPGWVEYHCVGAGHGQMMVRDVENAEDEVRKQIEADREWIRNSENFEIIGEWPPIEFTKFEVMKR